MHRQRRNVVVAGVGLAASLALGSTLAGVSGATTRHLAPGARTTRTATGGTVKIAVLSLPASGGNPFGATYAGPAVQVMPAIFDALTTAAPGGAQPALALSWKMRNPKTWQFTLRQGVKFSDGEPFDAAAAAFTFNYLSSKAGEATAIGGTYPFLAGATVVSKYVVDIHTSIPDPILPQDIDQVNIVAPKYWQRVGPNGYATKPVGTGPYEVTNWGATAIALRRFPGSWRPAHYQRLQIIGIPDQTSAYQALQSNEVQVMYTLSLSELAQTKHSRKLQLVTVDTGNNVALQFVNSPGAPTQNKQVRVALNEAIDRAAIIKDIFHGIGAPAYQGITPGIPGADGSLKPIPYDPTAARQLLAKAGYPNGLKLTADVAAGGVTGEPETLQVVQAELAQIGVQLTYNTLPFPQWLGDFLAGKFPGAQLTTILYSVTPQFDGALPLARGSCLEKPAPVWCVPGNGQSILIEKAQTQTNLKKRTQELAQVAKLERTDPPAIWMFEEVNTLAASKSVSVDYQPIGTIDFSTLAPAS